MEPQDPAAASGPPFIAYTRCWDARTFVVRASLSPAERARLQLILDQLAALGTIALGRSDTNADDAGGLLAVVAHLRRTLGELVVDAAVAAAGHPATPMVSPQAIIPLWDFEPIDGRSDRLVAHGLLLGGDLVVEALPVEDDDDQAPTSARHALWIAGAGDADTLGSVRIPGRTGPYALFATIRAG